MNRLAGARVAGYAEGSGLMFVRVRDPWVSLFVLGAVSCGPSVLEPPANSGSDGTSSSGRETATGMSPTTATSTGSVSTSTGSVSTTGSLDTGSESDEGIGFIQDPDACAGAPPGTSFHCSIHDCDYQDQNDCGEMRCVPSALGHPPVWWINQCTPVSRDPVPPGGVCTMEESVASGLDDCTTGSMCWGADPTTLQGTCVSGCDPRDPTACMAPQECMLFGEPIMSLCMTPCSPLDPAACPSGDACRFALGDRDHGFMCFPEQGGVPSHSGRVCGESECAPGQGCAIDSFLESCERERCCTPFCDLDDPGADAACAAQSPGHICRPWGDLWAVVEGQENVGACMLPP